MVFGEKLRQLLATKFDTIHDAASEFNINYSQLSQYINNRRNPSIEFLYMLIKRYPDLDLNWLLREDDIDYNAVAEDAKAYKKVLSSSQIIQEIELLLGDLKGKLAQ